MADKPAEALECTLDVIPKIGSWVSNPRIKRRKLTERAKIKLSDIYRFVVLYPDFYGVSKTGRMPSSIRPVLHVNLERDGNPSNVIPLHRLLRLGVGRAPGQP